MEPKATAHRRHLRSTLMAGILVLMPLAMMPTAQAGPVEDLVRDVFRIPDAIVFCEEDSECGCDDIANCGDPSLQQIVDALIDESVPFVLQTVDDTVILVLDFAGFALDTADPWVAIVLNFVRDDDNDLIIDWAEAEICGRAITRTTINTGSPDTGECTSTSNYDPPSTNVLPSISTIVNLIHQLMGNGDKDFIPDLAEPAICLVENQNHGGDGTCSNGNYSPP